MLYTLLQVGIPLARGAEQVETIQKDVTALRRLDYCSVLCRPIQTETKGMAATRQQLCGNNTLAHSCPICPRPWYAHTGPLCHID